MQMTSLKPRGAEGGPKRTPPHLGDAWQKKTDYEVEQVTTTFLSCIKCQFVIDIIQKF